MKHYVYFYLDPTKPGNYVYGEYNFGFEPFYIGSGVGKRLFYHLSEANSNKKSYKLNKIRKLKSIGVKPIIGKYKENLFEYDSRILEIKMVAAIGRFDLKKVH